ncbi:metallopeptidase family protein [Mongoliimonas terrestris]|uniref:metallopeptidase family protein n=1 Tax=Mongoliimonas terrestris TaxID=1709001 RepID=UPI0009496BDA|nr:metallopeptidase family protein [Mongoliimonas terrestris]
MARLDDSSHRIARWQDAAAPDLDDFVALGERALADLPETFRALCGDVEIRVDDFPDEEALKELGLESPFDLLGLFQGVGIAHDAAVGHTGRLPNRVWLYRRPILDYWAEHEETLGAVVTHVLVHEIGHHFGLSDDDIDALEATTA